MRPIIAIVGRPNVGKSTLFNRLVGRSVAIVENAPGVTRDRHYADAEWSGRCVTVVDTGGFVGDEKDALRSQIRAQAQVAVEECDVILFVTDGREGLTPADQEVARTLRRAAKPVVLAVNKLEEARTADAALAEFHRVGLGPVVGVSAAHGRNTGALLDLLVATLPDDSDEPAAEEPDGVRLAIVGRPNVGKSTLVNALLKQPRLITSEFSGTTRDSIDSRLSFGGRDFVLTDTAGIRRKSAIAQRVEHFAVLSALRVIDRCDVVALLLDAKEPAVHQDAAIAALSQERGRALLLVVNKWDLVRGKTSEEAFRDEVKRSLPFVAYAPILFVSALEARKVEKVLELTTLLFDQNHFKASTPHLNRVLAHITTEHPAPFSHGRALRLYYCAQVSVAPPTFMFMCNRPQEIPDRYKRYITNHLRKTFDLKTPVRLVFRERPGGDKRKERVARMRARAKR